MKTVVPVAGQPLTTQFSVGGRRVNLAADPQGLQFLHGIQHLNHDGARADKANHGSVALGCAAKQVHALDDALVDALWFGWHGVVLVVDCDVMEHVLVLHMHLFDAVLDDGSQLVGKGRVPCSHGRVGVRHQQGVPVLMLQAFPVERGTARCCTYEETAGALVGC